MRTASSLGWLLLIGLSTTSLGAQMRPRDASPTQVRQQLDSAKLAARRGDLDAAEDLYKKLLKLPASASERLEATFGLAFIGQRRLAAADTAGRGITVAGVVAEYAAVERAGSPSLRHAAATNRGLLLAESGYERAAARAFENAVEFASASTMRSALLRAAAARLAAGDHDRAEAWYRRALEGAPRDAMARTGLLSVLLRQGASDSLLATTRRWRADTTIATAITEVLIEHLLSPRDRGSPVERLLIVEVARNLAVRRITVEGFGLELVSPLNAVREKRPALDAPILSMLEAFAPMDALGYRVGSTAGWWRSQRGGPETSFAWSGLLRMIGDEFRLQPDREDWARAYYEAALGIGDGTDAVIADHADPAALRPLGLIYADRRDLQATRRLADAVDRFVTTARVSPTADSGRALLDVRDYHLAVASLLSFERSTAPQLVAEADRHTSRMIQLGDRLLAAGQARPTDPPSLLTDFAVSLDGRGDSARTKDVTRRLEASLRELNVVNAAAEAVRRVREKETTDRPRPYQESRFVRPDLTSVPVRPEADRAAARPAVAIAGPAGAAAARAGSSRPGAEAAAAARADTERAVGAAPAAAAVSVRRVPSPLEAAQDTVASLGTADDKALAQHRARRDSIGAVIIAAAARREQASAARDWAMTLRKADEALAGVLRANTVATAAEFTRKLDADSKAGRTALSSLQAEELRTLIVRFGIRANAFSKADTTIRALPRAR